MPHIQVEQHSIYYELNGQGNKTLLLFNGITMSTVAWTLMLPILEAHYRLLRLDFLGQGESAKPLAPFYSLPEQANIARALLAHLHIDTCYLVGFSYGGMVAQHFAHHHSACIEKLLLASTTTWSDTVDIALCDNWIATHDAGGFELGYQMNVPLLFSSRFLASQSAALPELRRISSLADWPSIVRLLEGIKQHDARTWLDTLRMPVHIIVGTEDRLTPPFQAERLHERIIGSTLALLPGTGHALHLEAPEAFCRAITQFCPP